MERDDEVKGSGNSYDFGARMYDSRLGRFLSMDAQSHTQPSWSPYKGFYSNPLIFNDPDGNTEYLTIFYDNKKTGEKVQIRIQVSDDVKGRFNVQTGIYQYYDIEREMHINIDKEGTYAVKINEKVGAFKCSLGTCWMNNQQNGGMRLVSINGEGNPFWTKENVETLNIDDLLGLVGISSAHPKINPVTTLSKFIDGLSRGETLGEKLFDDNNTEKSESFETIERPNFYEGSPPIKVDKDSVPYYYDKKDFPNYATDSVELKNTKTGEVSKKQSVETFNKSHEKK
jgi:RHS repeat-associated protein